MRGKGQVLLNKYVVGKTLGRGSFGKVKLCYRLKDGKAKGPKLAVKIISWESLKRNSTSKADLEDTIQRLRLEVEILKKLDHPNVIKLVDFLEHKKTFYLVLQYAAEGELFDFLAARGRLSEELAARFFKQMVDAVEYCHDKNVAHRDLKPENVLLDSDFRLKITDFGLSSILADNNHIMKTQCGSPHYAAPEVLLGNGYDERVDIWSMGIILYTLVVGRLPFDSDSKKHVFEKVKAGKYFLPAQSSPQFQDIVQRMLVRAPEHRITFKQIRQHPWLKVHIPDGGQAPLLSISKSFIKLANNAPVFSSAQPVTVETTDAYGVRIALLQSEDKAISRNNSAAGVHVTPPTPQRTPKRVPSKLDETNSHTACIDTPPKDGVDVITPRTAEAPVIRLVVNPEVDEPSAAAAAPQPPKVTTEDVMEAYAAGKRVARLETIGEEADEEETDDERPQDALGVENEYGEEDMLSDAEEICADMIHEHALAGESELLDEPKRKGKRSLSAQPATSSPPGTRHAPESVLRYTDAWIDEAVEGKARAGSDPHSRGLDPALFPKPDDSHVSGVHGGETIRSGVRDNDVLSNSVPEQTLTSLVLDNADTESHHSTFAADLSTLDLNSLVTDGTTSTTGFGLSRSTKSTSGDEEANVPVVKAAPPKTPPENNKTGASYRNNKPVPLFIPKDDVVPTAPLLTPPSPAQSEASGSPLSFIRARRLSQNSQSGPSLGGLGGSSGAFQPSPLSPSTRVGTGDDLSAARQHRNSLSLTLDEVEEDSQSSLSISGHLISRRKTSLSSETDPDGMRSTQHTRRASSNSRGGPRVNLLRRFSHNQAASNASTDDDHSEAGSVKSDPRQQQLRREAERPRAQSISGEGIPTHAEPKYRYHSQSLNEEDRKSFADLVAARRRTPQGTSDRRSRAHTQVGGIRHRSAEAPVGMKTTRAIDVASMGTWSNANPAKIMGELKAALDHAGYRYKEVEDTPYMLKCATFSYKFELNVCRIQSLTGVYKVEIRRRQGEAFAFHTQVVTKLQTKLRHAREGDFDPVTIEA